MKKLFMLLVVCMASMLTFAQGNMALNSSIHNFDSWPPDVPTDYVTTPFGYFHPTCVRHVLEGETVLGDGRIQYADGSVEASAPVCNYPRYSPQGALITGDDPTTNGWVEWAYATTSSSFHKMIVSWGVPPNPPSYNGQTIYLFPGLVDSQPHNPQSILQPVLQYGPSPAGGGQYWSVAAWNCCISGITDHSTLIGANNGTVGTIWAPNCERGANHCSTWNVEAKETGSGQTTTLTETPSDGQIFNWAAGGAVEVYRVQNCDQYPGNWGDAFTVQLYDNEDDLIANPGWTPVVDRGVTPQCGFDVTVSPSVVTLKWKP